MLSETGIQLFCTNSQLKVVDELPAAGVTENYNKSCSSSGGSSEVNQLYLDTIWFFKRKNLFFENNFLTVHSLSFYTIKQAAEIRTMVSLLLLCILEKGKMPPDGTVTAIQCVNYPAKVRSTGTTQVLRYGQTVHGIHPFTLCRGLL